MKLPKTELRLIEGLHEEGSFDSVRGAAKAIDSSKAQVSRAVKRLEAHEVVLTTLASGKLQLELNSAVPAVTAFGRLRQRHPAFPVERLSGRILDVCWFLDEWRRTQTIADALGLTIGTVSPMVNDLARDAVVKKDGHEYQMSRRYDELHEFAVALVEASWLTEVDGGHDALLWTSPEEAVVATDRPDSLGDMWTISGAGAFERFGVKLFLSDHRVLYAGHRDISPEAAVAHALLYEDNVRSVTHALLVVDTVAFDVDAFVGEAKRVGVAEKTIDAVSRYARTGSLDNKRLPSEEKMSSLWKQYDINKEGEEDVVGGTGTTDSIRGNIVERGGKWVVEQEDDSPGEWAAEQQPLQDLLGIPVRGKIRYVIRLVDENQQDWLYVGESTRILSRLSEHVNKGGDFGEARRDTKMAVTDVEEVRQDITEQELYEEACEKYDVPESRICGGR